MSPFFRYFEERRTSPMKKHRKQSVNVLGQKRLVDVPVDKELYEADNHNEYQRARSKKKHVSLREIILADFTADVMDDYEEAQLQECLKKAVQALNEEERLLIKCIYYDELTEQQTAVILHVSQKTVNVRKHKIINKLRDSLINWL
jgi:RNA polymerase sigma factor (sigma-70 family)